MGNFLFSIRTRALLLVGIGFGVFLVTMGYHAVAERMMRLEFAREQLLSTAKLIATEEHDALEFTMNFLASAAQSREVGRFLQGEECQGALAPRIKQEPRLANIVLALPDGTLICSATSTGQPLNIADRPYFKTALATSDTVIGEAFVGRLTGTWILPFYRAVRDGNGRVQGVVGVGLKLSWLNRELANAKYPDEARMGLIDANGRVLARHPDPEGWVGKDASATSFFKTLKAHGGEGVAEELGFDGVRRMYGLARFADTAAGPISLWVGFAKDSVTREVERDFAWTVIAVVVLLLLTFAATWAGAERLLFRRISILSGAALRLGQGYLGTRTGLGSGRDELARLGQHFDEMAESLEAKSRQIILADRALKVLAAWNRTLLRPSDEHALAEGMCRAIVDAGGYRMAWVGFAEDNADKTVRAVASAGAAEGYLENLRVTWADTARGQSPAGRAIRQGVPIVVNDLNMNLDAEVWRKHVVRYGYGSIMALPFKTDDGLIGVLVIGATETNAFAEQEAVLLAEVAVDLSSAIFVQRSRGERARMEESLRTGEERFRAAAEASLDALLVLKSVRDAAGNIVDFEVTDMNGRAAHQLGLAKDEVVGKTFFQLLPVYRTAGFFNKYVHVVATRTPLDEEFPFDVPGAERKWFRQQVVAVGDGIAVSLRDITVWKTAGDKIREGEERLRLAMAGAHMGAWSVDLESDTHSISEGMGPIFGLPNGAGPRSTEALMEAVHPDDREALASAMKQDRETAQASQSEFRVLWPDGTVHWVEARSNVICDAAGKPVRSVGVLADITQRKLDVVALQRANRALKTLSAANEALVRATSESELLHEVCRVIVDKGGYRLASVGYPRHDQEKTLVPMAWAGAEEGYLTAVLRTTADTEQSHKPIARALRSGKPEITRDVGNDPAFAPVKEWVTRLGYVSNLALPILDGKRVIGAISIHASGTDAFDDAEILLLQELADDLSYGITTLRTREERDRIADAHEHHAAILRKSLEDSIQAIASTVEMRDPYTSGHQKRVAELAVALATEMGLPDEQIRGLHLAGVVHDLGKISVPAEILSKPGKLTTIEFMLIKGHAQAGYEILKDIDFPWPIATIVWQHHERLDGSGYPQGLKGEDILLESRIMAVADVVEAIASHRPYRPTLGIDAALKEIERGRGTVYDPAVADACVKLFREGGFALPG